MILFALILSLQAAAAENLTAEANRMGRLTGAAGACSGLGYIVDDEQLSRAMDDYIDRVVASDESISAIKSIQEAGISAVVRDLNLPSRSSVPDDKVVATATDAFARAKRFCRGFADQYPAIFPTPDQSDRNLDEILATIISNSRAN